MKVLSARNIVEILGIAGVIGSLVFVGLELSQNSSIARTAAYHDYVQGWTDYNLTLATDDQLNALFLRALEGESLADFSPEERSKLRYIYIALLRQWEGVFRSVQENILPVELLDTIISAYAFQQPSFMQAWPTLRPIFTQDFVEFMENEILNNQELGF